MSIASDRATLRNTASATLRLRFQGIIASNAGERATAPAFGDRFSLSQAPIQAYLWPHETPPDFDNFRRIEDFDAAIGVITMNRAFSGVVGVNIQASIYLVLTPGDWNDIIDEELAKLHRPERVSITAIEGTSLYSLASAAEWIQTQQQIVSMCWRYTPSGSEVYERDIGAYKLITDDGVVSLLLEARPDEDEDDYTIEIDARRHYDALADDADTTTCPLPLALSAVKLGALRRVWSIMGDRSAKALYGQDMEDAEREYVDRSRGFVEQVAHTPMHSEAPPAGPEMAVGADFGAW